MDRQQLSTYWINSAHHDLDVAETLFNNAKYDWCLFIAHLVLEKLFKAFYVKNTGTTPPRIHDLVRLADMAKIEINDDTMGISGCGKYFQYFDTIPGRENEIL